MKIDCVHFYIRDAAKAKDWFVRNVGFKAIANSKNEHTQTEIVSLHSARLAFSSPLNSRSPVAEYLKSHPSGVTDVAFRVQNIQSILDRAKSLGLNILQPLKICSSSLGKFKQAQIQGWNCLHHTLIEEITDKFTDKFNAYLPNTARKSQASGSETSITHIDHIVLNVSAGKLHSAVELYRALFGFRIQQSFKIKTQTSGLYSQALIDESGEVQFNINEPTSSNSQIQEFIDLNGGSGIQHLALRSQNLIRDVARMQQQGVDFLKIPSSYYDRLDKNLGLSVAEQKAIAARQILVDHENSPTTEDIAKNSRSLLMQIFTQPMFEQPTFFLEFIERRQQARGFGRGNFTELFAAVEREQSKNDRRSTLQP